MNDLESLYDLIDELLVIDVVEDAELGMHVRKWYERYNNPQSEDDEEWDNLMSEDLNLDGEWD